MPSQFNVTPSTTPVFGERHGRDKGMMPENPTKLIPASALAEIQHALNKLRHLETQLEALRGYEWNLLDVVVEYDYHEERGLASFALPHDVLIEVVEQQVVAQRESIKSLGVNPHA